MPHDPHKLPPCPTWCTIDGPRHRHEYPGTTPTGLLIRDHERTVASHTALDVVIIAQEIAGPDGTGPIVAPPAIALPGFDMTATLTAADARALAATLNTAADALDAL